MVTPGLVQQVIRRRLKERQERERQQRKLWLEQDDWHETIRSKLEGRFHDPQFVNFERCGQEDFECHCQNCGTVHKFKYQCCIKWCPRCQWKRVEKRKRILELWTARIKQPKHLVLTQKNFPVLTPRRIRDHTRNLARFRRSAAFKKVRGGCVSVEMTNEGTGWHLHSHWLLDVRWLDMQQVSKTWGHIVGQSFAIAKVMDVRERSYLQEVTKYVCSGSEMAQWPPDQVHEFVRAVKGRRFFFTFGTLFHDQAEVRRELMSQEREPMTCECGSSKFKFYSATDAEVRAILRECEQPRRQSVERPNRCGSEPDDKHGKEARLFPD